MKKQPSQIGGCWPTAIQERMLQAALWQGPEAVQAWEGWQAVVDVTELDLGSTRLLPLLHHNLKRHGIVAPGTSRFKGVYRQVWYKNQLLASRVTPLLRALHAAGVRTMLLKGAALIHGYYSDYGLRPMSDFDILVPVPQALQAVEILTAQGWTLGPGEIKLPTASSLSMMHAQEYRSPEGERVDLHWHVYQQCPQAYADDEFWQDARPVRFNDVETAVPNPTDLLIHVCVHGTEGKPGMPPLRWVADAMTILERSGAEIDWDCLLRRAHARRLSLPLQDTLIYLAQAMRVPIPPESLAALDAMPTTRAERRAYDAWLLPPVLRGPLTALLLEYHIYRQWVQEDGRSEKGRTFLHYMQYHWQFESLWLVPFSALARMGRRGWNQFVYRCTSPK